MSRVFGVFKKLLCFGLRIPTIYFNCIGPVCCYCCQPEGLSTSVEPTIVKEAITFIRFIQENLNKVDQEFVDKLSVNRDILELSPAGTLEKGLNLYLGRKSFST